MRLLIATKNAHKTAEIRAMLGADWQVEDLNVHPEVIAPEETGTTFEANAIIKAVEASRIFPGLVLSDDSGLEVDALGGEPGVQSARYAGVHGDDAANRTRLVRELKARATSGKCTARFRCAMALAERGKVIATFDGKVEGAVITEERGSGGFGYDALFIPDGYEGTFGELPDTVKNQLSHRARALEKTVAFFAERNGSR